MTKKTFKSLDKKYGINSEYWIAIMAINGYTGVLLYPAFDSVLYLKRELMKCNREAMKDPSPEADYNKGCIKTALSACDEIVEMVKFLSTESAFMANGRFSEDSWLNWITDFFAKIGKIARFLETIGH